MRDVGRTGSGEWKIGRIRGGRLRIRGLAKRGPATVHSANSAGGPELLVDESHRVGGEQCEGADGAGVSG